METTENKKTSEVYEQILNIVKKIPRKNIVDDAPDAPSVAHELHKLFLKLLPLQKVSARLFGVYDRNGNIKSVKKEPYSAFEEAHLLNKQKGINKDEYFIDWVIVG